MIIHSGINEELLVKTITVFHEEIELQSGFISSSHITIVKEDFYCFITENSVMAIGRIVEDGSSYPCPWCVVNLESVNGTIVEINQSWEIPSTSEARISTYQSYQDFTDVSDYGRMVLSTFMI